MAWRLHGGPGPLVPPGDPGDLHEIAVAACQTLQGHPELYYPAVTVDGEVRLIDGDTGYPTVDAAQRAAKPMQARLTEAARMAGMETFDDIGEVLDDAIGAL